MKQSPGGHGAGSWFFYISTMAVGQWGSTIHAELRKSYTCTRKGKDKGILFYIEIQTGTNECLLTRSPTVYWIHYPHARSWVPYAVPMGDVAEESATSGDHTWDLSNRSQTEWPFDQQDWLLCTLLIYQENAGKYANLCCAMDHIFQHACHVRFMAHWGEGFLEKWKVLVSIKYQHFKSSLTKLFV